MVFLFVNFSPVKDPGGWRLGARFSDSQTCSLGQHRGAQLLKIRLNIRRTKKHVVIVDYSMVSKMRQEISERNLNCICCDLPSLLSAVNQMQIFSLDFYMKYK